MNVAMNRFKRSYHGCGCLSLARNSFLFKSDIGKQVQKQVQDVLKPDSIAFIECLLSGGQMPSVQQPVLSMTCCRHTSELTAKLRVGPGVPTRILGLLQDSLASPMFRVLLFVRKAAHEHAADCLSSQTSGNRDSHGDSHGDYARWSWFGLLWMVGLVATQACQPLLVGYYMLLTLASFLLLCAWIDARTKTFLID